MVEMIEKLEKEILVLLCKMEKEILCIYGRWRKIFLSDFFNPMQHLLIHLP
jgi:hypothetical protein